MGPSQTVALALPPPSPTFILVFSSLLARCSASRARLACIQGPIKHANTVAYGHTRSVALCRYSAAADTPVPPQAAEANFKGHQADSLPPPPASLCTSQQISSLHTYIVMPRLSPLTASAAACFSFCTSRGSRSTWVTALGSSTIISGCRKEQ